MGLSNVFGAALVRRASVSAPIVRARLVLTKMFSKYLLVTNVTTGLTLAGTGDFINQRYERMANLRTTYSIYRTRNQCIQGIIFASMYHFWYIFLDRVLPGNAARVVMKKVLADQIVMVPIGIPLFLISLGLLERRSKQSIAEEIKAKTPSLLLFEWTVGPVTQLFNFYFLPTRFRVLYDSVVCLCFDGYYTHIKYRSHLKEGEKTD